MYKGVVGPKIRQTMFGEASSKQIMVASDNRRATNYLTELLVIFTRLIRITCLCVMALLLGCKAIQTPSPDVSAIPAKGSDRLVIYGGFGHMGNLSQPAFGRILFSEDETSAGLISGLNRAVLGEVTTNSFGVSAHPVAISNDDVRNVVSTQFDESLESVSFEELEAAFTKIYLLVVTASHEHQVTVHNISEGGATQDEYFIAGVTAMLVEMSGGFGDARVVISASSLTEEVATDQRSDLPQSEVDRYFSMAYQSAAIDAVNKLSARSNNFNIDQLDERFEQGIVTGVYIQDQHARSLFGIGSTNQSADICPRSTTCSDGSKNCNLLLSMIANLTTESLSEKGFPMLPALRWSQWGHLATERTAVTLRLSRGAPMVEDAIKINLSELSADYKYNLILHTLDTQVSSHDVTDKFMTREHYAFSQLCRYETDALDSDKLVSRQVSKPFGNTGSGQPVLELFVTGENEQNPAVERAYKLIAIINTLKGF